MRSRRMRSRSSRKMREVGAYPSTIDMVQNPNTCMIAPPPIGPTCRSAQPKR